MDPLDRALAFTLAWEGGFVDNPNDPGGATNYGISQRAFPHLDIRNLTLPEAKDIYKQAYWNAIDGDRRPLVEAIALFDFAVHSGVRRALEVWGRSKDVGDYMANRLDFLAALENFNHFGRGWVRRVNDLRRLIDKELQADAITPDVELIQLYHRDRTFAFYPVKTTVGKTASGRTKLMARLG